MRIVTVQKEVHVNVHVSVLLNIVINFIFFQGIKMVSGKNVVVNLATAKKKFERLLVHKFIWAMFEKLLHGITRLSFSTEALDLLSEFQQNKPIFIYK